MQLINRPKQSNFKPIQALIKIYNNPTYQKDLRLTASEAHQKVISLYDRWLSIKYSTAVHQQKIAALRNANASAEEISTEYDLAIEKCDWGTPVISRLLFQRAIHRVEKLQDFEGVVRDLQLAIMKAHANTKPNIIHYLGFVYYKMQKWDLAEKYYTQALALDPSPERQKRYELFLVAKKAATTSNRKVSQSITSSASPTSTLPVVH